MSVPPILLTQNGVIFRSSGTTRDSKISSTAIDVISVSGGTDEVTCNIRGVSDPVLPIDAVPLNYLTNNVVLTDTSAQTKAGRLSISDTTNSTSTATGCLILAGGLGVALDMQVGGSIRANHFFATSDERFKTNITPISSALELAAALDIVSFNWKYDETKRTVFGVLAQKLQKDPKLEGMVLENDDGRLAVDYNGIASIALAASKELQQKVEELQKRIEELESKLENNLTSKENGTRGI